MLAFPSMLVGAAEAAGIKCPPDPDDEKSWKKEEYLHFFVFCNVQLGRSMRSPSQHWDNAKIIAALTEAECKTVTPAHLTDKGFEW